MSSSAAATPRVAVVGAGIAGASAAAALARGAPGLSVTVFDMGRAPGGRSSRRAPWDFGCQFFRADTPAMAALAAEWCGAGLAAEWRGHFAGVGPDADFFGLPAAAGPLYVGVGGMDAISRALLAGDGIEVRSGTAVAGVAPAAAGGGFALAGAGGADLGSFDAVVVAAAGLDAGGGAPKPAARTAMFSCLLELEAPLDAELDAVAVAGAGAVVWFAARAGSKPGFESDEESARCWTIVSTPAYAADLIARSPVRDAAGAVVRPSREWLADVGTEMAEAFRAVVAGQTGAPAPAVRAATAHRWGAALPSSAAGADVRRLEGVDYDVGRGGGAAAQRAGDGADVVVAAGSGGRLVYAGDFASGLRPGFEAACLSGREAGRVVGEALLFF